MPQHRWTSKICQVKRSVMGDTVSFYPNEMSKIGKTYRKIGLVFVQGGAAREWWSSFGVGHNGAKGYYYCKRLSRNRYLSPILATCSLPPHAQWCMFMHTHTCNEEEKCRGFLTIERKINLFFFFWGGVIVAVWKLWWGGTCPFVGWSVRCSPGWPHCTQLDLSLCSLSEPRLHRPVTLL